MRYSLVVIIAAITVGCGDQSVTIRGRPTAKVSSTLRVIRREGGEDSGTARIRLVAADTIEPVANAQFQPTLIGADGGDGGFHTYMSDRHGDVIVGESPGRYQLYIDPPENSRYEVTQYYGEGNYLVIRDDGSCAPSEFKVTVTHPTAVIP